MEISSFLSWYIKSNRLRCHIGVSTQGNHMLLTDTPSLFAVWNNCRILNIKETSEWPTDKKECQSDYWGTLPGTCVTDVANVSIQASFVNYCLLLYKQQHKGNFHSSTINRHLYSRNRVLMSLNRRILHFKYNEFFMTTIWRQPQEKFSLVHNKQTLA